MNINIELEITEIDRCASCKLQSVLNRLRVNQREVRYIRARTDRLSAEISEFMLQPNNSAMAHN